MIARNNDNPIFPLLYWLYLLLTLWLTVYPKNVTGRGIFQGFGSHRVRFNLLKKILIPSLPFSIFARAAKTEKGMPF
jgi:hypothetical protein